MLEYFAPCVITLIPGGQLKVEVLNGNHEVFNLRPSLVPCRNAERVTELRMSGFTPRGFGRLRFDSEERKGDGRWEGFLRGSIDTHCRYAAVATA